MTEDSLKVTENDDGTLQIEWDANDPRYSHLNDLSQEELQDYVTTALQNFIDTHDEID